MKLLPGTRKDGQSGINYFMTQWLWRILAALSIGYCIFAIGKHILTS